MGDGYKWTENADGPETAEKIPTGLHRLRIAKVIHHKGDGSSFSSRAGDPQMMVVFCDREERECTTMFTLSRKAGWTLARLLDAAGQNLEQLESSSVEPADFAEPTFAKNRLVGLELIGFVEWEKSDDGKEYSRVEPKKESELTKDAIRQLDDTREPVAGGVGGGAHAPVDDSDIPFSRADYF